MSKVFGITDSWKIGTREGTAEAVVPHRRGVEGVGGASHFVTS